MNWLWLIAIVIPVEGVSMGFNSVSLAEDAPISVIAQTDPRLDEADRLEQTILLAGVKLIPTDPRLAEADRIEQQVEDLYQQGKYAEASRIAEQVLAIREAILGDHPDTATSLITLGFIYDTTGQYAEAKPLYERALTIRERQLGANHLDTATSLNRLAFLFYEMGRYEEAEPLYHRALAIHEAQLGSEHLVTAISLNFLALLYEVTNRYEEAERLYQRTLGIREKQLGSSHPDTALSLDNLAVLYQKTGRYEEAESLHQRALAVREEQEEDPNTALSLTLLADLYQVMGRYSEADPLYKRALTINEQQLGANHPNTAQSLNNLATLYWSQDRFDQSLDFLHRGLDVEEINILQNVSTLTEREQKAYLETLKTSQDLILSLHLQHLPTNPQSSRVALTTILRRKGQILDTLSNRLQRLRADASPADRQKLEQLSQLYTQLTNLYNKGLGNLTPEAYRQQVQTLESQIEQLQKQLAQDLPELSPQPVTLEAIQALIPQDAVLIEFFRYQPFNPKAKPGERYGESRYAAYVLRPGNGDPVGIDLGEAAAIDQRLGFFRQNLTDPTSTNQLSQSSKIVYQAVFQPLTPYLGNATHLLISPDSHLNLIPFAALQNPQGQYLLEGYEITALSSGRDLVRYQTHYATQEPPVIIAHPNYNGSSDPQAAQLIAQGNRGITQVSAITNSTPAALPSSSVEQIRVSIYNESSKSFKYSV
jgi:tetratricopeptide (TPR) repeat protein